MKLIGRGCWWLGAPAVLFALVFASTASAVTTPADPTVEGGQTYAAATEGLLPIPEGVGSIQARAIGGRGGTDLNESQSGGLAAVVDGHLAVQPHEVLFVVVGGNADKNEGGFNGGSGRPFTGAPLGGGGGGASDIRTVAPFEPNSLESRVLVAGGGGGAGGLGNGSELRASAAGGNAGAGGGRAESGGADNTIGSGGMGGSAGQAAIGGNGGEGGFPYGTGCGSHAGNGGLGQLGTGGAGGEGSASTPAGWGGGGGGGLYGGGGGGGGTLITCTTEPIALGGGGGGGGSSLAPPGGSVTVDNNANSVPEVSVHWSIPGTVMSGPGAYTDEAEPAVDLTSEEAGAEFECRVDSEEESAWEPCGAEPAIGPLADGSHRVEARAVNAEGNFDPTPAALEFFVETAPPVVIELNGPSVAAPTTETQPTFTFVGGSIIPVHFECAFDGAAAGPCTGERSDTPAAPLSIGEHTFTLTPIDAAGNVGAPVTRAFVVSPPPLQGSSTGGTTTSPSSASAGTTASPSPGRVAPTIELGKVKLNAKKGTATVLATVNGPGELRVTGPNAKTTTVKAGGAGSVAIAVTARRKALKQLKAKGALTARVTVTFTAAGGGTATASKAVRLREEPPARAHPRR